MKTFNNWVAEVDLSQINREGRRNASPDEVRQLAAQIMKMIPPHFSEMDRAKLGEMISAGHRWTA